MWTPMHTFVVVLIVIAVIAVVFAFWIIPKRGTGQWWKSLHWDNRNEKRYD
jgi:hypothetical protein